MTEIAADGIAVEAVHAATDDVRTLIEELDRDLAREYSAEQRHGLAIEAIFQPHVRFFIARQGGLALGCGGVAFFPTFAELKRMFVREGGRGRGIARALLERIEAETIASGRDVLRLETGDRQLAAIRLYERAGFVPCEIFGDYASLAPQAVATSVFLEKRLERTLAT
jgi:putative acetyltransferase